MADWEVSDGVSVPGQNFAVLSCVGPSANQKADVVAVTFRGAFHTLEEAQKHSRKIRDRSGKFDVWVASMNEWLVLPPNQTNVRTEYSDPRLNEIMKTEMEASERATRDFQEHKQSLMKNGMSEEEARREWATMKLDPKTNPLGSDF